MYWKDDHLDRATNIFEHIRQCPDPQDCQHQLLATNWLTNYDADRNRETRGLFARFLHALQGYPR